jgi:hypothetical protein
VKLDNPTNICFDVVCQVIPELMHVIILDRTAWVVHIDNRIACHFFLSISPVFQSCIEQRAHCTLLRAGSFNEKGDLVMMQTTFYKRVLVPSGIVLFLMILSINIYDFSPDIGLNHPGLRRILSDISALFMFISIWLGAFIAHPLAYGAGASMKERVLAGLITPLAWSAKMVYGAGCIYGGWELTYWSFHPLIVGVIGVAILEMGVAEIVCRLAYRKKSPIPERVMHPSVVIMLFTGLIVVPVALWNGGTFLFYIFVDIYTMLFY